MTGPTEPTTVAGAVAQILGGAGVRRCYTVPGESFLTLIDAIERDPRLRLVSVRHESGASFMADADARLSGIPSVALASRGPGSANLAIGVHTAYQDSTPMLVLLGQVERAVRGRDAFQEVDLTAFYRPITKWAVTAEHADEVPELVARGLRVATSGRPGPVMIALPSDLVDEPVNVPAPQPGPPHPGPPPPLDDSVLDSLAEQLLAAERPVAIVGEQARRARPLLERVAERFGLGVCTSFRRQDAFDTEHPQFLGHLGLAVPEATRRALESTELLLVIGTRLDEVTSQRYRLPGPATRVVHIGRYGGAGIDADPAEVLRALAERPSPSRTVDWSQVHTALERWSTPPAGEGAADEAVHPAEVVAALHRTLPPNAVITNDAGNFAAFLHRYWRFPVGTAQLAPVNGAMGYAVPAAVAASLCAPDRPCVAVVGDGGVLMTGQEIETAVRMGARIVVVILQNGLYGTIAMHQARELGRTSGVDIGPVDLVGWAQSLGAAGFGVTHPGELDDTIRRALATGRPSVVAVRTDPDVISPTDRLADLLTTREGAE